MVSSKRRWRMVGSAAAMAGAMATVMTVMTGAASRADAARVLHVAEPAAAATTSTAGAQFVVRLAGAAAEAAGKDQAGKVSGRLVVLVIGPGAKLRPGTSPLDGPFWEDPQPLFSVAVNGAAVGEAMVVAGDAQGGDVLGTPFGPSALPPGEYRAAARLVRAKETSDWRETAGNFYTSTPVAFSVKAAAPEDAASPASVVELTLDKVTAPEAFVPAAGVEVVEVPSKALSAFAGRQVMLRAGVVLPTGYDPAGERRYAAVYEVPGFGGRHRGANAVAARRARQAAAGGKEGGGKEGEGPGGGAAAELARGSFWIVLDPESPNGHTLFVDSANNGPWGRALTEELIPELERRYRLIARPEARVLRGHSSGGWSTIWLAVTYPQVFGGAWSTAPDPVDFRRFQLMDIYAHANAFSPREDDPAVKGIVDWVRANGMPSYRRGGTAVMSVREEVGGEHVCGPDNTGGGQWASWQAVFGPRNARGNPAALFDPETGVIDRAVAESYRRFDLSGLVRSGAIAPEAFDRVRLVVGDADNFYLEQAVMLLKASLEEKRAGRPGNAGAAGPGYIKIVPGRDHGSVMATPEVRGFAGEMVDHFRAAGFLPAR